MKNFIENHKLLIIINLFYNFIIYNINIFEKNYIFELIKILLPINIAFVLNNNRKKFEKRYEVCEQLNVSSKNCRYKIKQFIENNREFLVFCNKDEKPEEKYLNKKKEYINKSFEDLENSIDQARNEFNFENKFDKFKSAKEKLDAIFGMYYFYLRDKNLDDNLDDVQFKDSIRIMTSKNINEEPEFKNFKDELININKFIKLESRKYKDEF